MASFLPQLLNKAKQKNVERAFDRPTFVVSHFCLMAASSAFEFVFTRSMRACSFVPEPAVNRSRSREGGRREKHNRQNNNHESESDANHEVMQPEGSEKTPRCRRVLETYTFRLFTIAHGFRLRKGGVGPLLATNWWSLVVGIGTHR